MEVSKMKPGVIIILQTISAIGFGVNLVFSMILMTVPNGHQIVADILETHNPPVMAIGLMTVICGMGTVLMTFSNAANTIWKESYLEEKKQIST
jgi:hypothetical protein